MTLYMTFTLALFTGFLALFVHVGWITLTASTIGPHLAVSILVLAYLLAFTWETNMSKWCILVTKSLFQAMLRTSVPKP